MNVDGWLSEPLFFDLGVKQGCGLSPILFALYVDDLVRSLHDSETGVLLSDEILSVLTFADDILCLSLTQPGMERQLGIVSDWCETNGMRMSVDKSSISTTDVSSNWKVVIGEEELGIDEKSSFVYLGVEFKVKARDFLEEQHKRMQKKANKYVYAILNTTKDSQDQSLVARSLWEYVAIPAIMYGAEACVIPGKVWKELETCQKRVASFVTGLQLEGGNVALWLESGLMPMKVRYHINVSRYFNKLMSVESGLLAKALTEHYDGNWSSSYRNQIKSIVEQYDLHYLSSKATLARISDSAWGSLLEEMYRLKSLKHLSLRNEKWELPEHVKDSKESKVLSKFRTGNAGLGNRVPLPGKQAPMKVCPLCQSLGKILPLNEMHVTLECIHLQTAREVGGIERYRKMFKGKDSSTLMWNYLGGDNCDSMCLLYRGRVLSTLLDQYLQKVHSLN